MRRQGTKGIAVILVHAVVGLAGDGRAAEGEQASRARPEDQAGQSVATAPTAPRVRVATSDQAVLGAAEHATTATRDQPQPSVMSCRRLPIEGLDCLKPSRPAPPITIPDGLAPASARSGESDRRLTTSGK